jgi:hypothetical protein|tara:strand:+ start:171 stop:380 length:210 start_codon:yes stop_codon:yes gene_type:complete
MIRNHYEIGQSDYEDQQEAFEALEAEREREAAEVLEPDQFMSDAEADADALASAGWGTDEDYGYYGDYE